MKHWHGAVAAISIFATGAVVAQGDPIKERQTILKGIGEATKPIAAMLKGATPYDNATVQKSLATSADGAKKLPDLFPDNSKTGEDTEALPKIWEEKTKFNAIYAKLAATATAAEGTISDQASLKANIGSVFGNCKTCHDDYRAKKN
jgi:cytochrome c556